VEVLLCIATFSVIAFVFAYRSPEAWIDRYNAKRWGKYPKSKVPWGEKMYPLRTFIEYHTDNKWRPHHLRSRKESVVYLNACSRFRIIPEVQSYSNAHKAQERTETLWETHGIYDFDEESRDFAKELWEAVFLHTNALEIEEVLKLLIEEHNKFIRYRKDGNIYGVVAVEEKPVIEAT